LAAPHTYVPSLSLLLSALTTQQAYDYFNGSDLWAHRLQGFLNQTARVIPADTGSVMTEVCEKKQLCNMDQWSFKAYLSRWLGLAAQMAPFTAAQIAPILQHNAKAAARVCNDVNLCGSRWNFDAFDGSTGVGQQMSALSVITANLFTQVRKPVTADTGGTSIGNPSAGTGDPTVLVKFEKIETSDKAGAWIITIMVIVFILGGSWALIMGE
jgi:hypothetical protein